MKEELDTDVELDRMDNNNGDKRDLIVNNVDRVEMSQSQMEERLILSNVINYVQLSKNPRNFQFMTIKPATFNKIVKDKDKNNFFLR